MSIIAFLVFGLVIGAVARLIKPGKQNLSVLATLALGVVGALIGGVVATALGTGNFGELNILGTCPPSGRRGGHRRGPPLRSSLTPRASGPGALTAGQRPGQPPRAAHRS